MDPNERSRFPADNPALRALAEGPIQALANHTILIARDGSERGIDDSAAPIRDENGKIHGVVLVFRDVTESARRTACGRPGSLSPRSSRRGHRPAADAAGRRGAAARARAGRRDAGWSNPERSGSLPRRRAVPKSGLLTWIEGTVPPARSRRGLRRSRLGTRRSGLAGEERRPNLGTGPKPPPAPKRTGSPTCALARRRGRARRPVMIDGESGGALVLWQPRPSIPTRNWRRPRHPRRPARRLHPAPPSAARDPPPRSGARRLLPQRGGGPALGGR